MVFSSLLFLFVFLPCTLIVYFLVPARAQNVILLLFSILFYAWGEPVYVFLMLFSCVFNYVSGLDIAADERHAKPKLAFALVVNIFMLGFFKYWGFFLGSINDILGIHIPYHDLPLPIGISFFTFQAMSYLIDVYRGEVRPNRNIIDFSLYIAMFPQLIAGPIVKYHDIAQQLRNKRITRVDFSLGVQRFVVGLAKKVLLANTLGAVYVSVCALGEGEASVVALWIGIFAYTLQIYFDFSGYSDMAIGLGRMFGFQFQENFNYPYISKSITEFWRRWHMSLSSWFRDYVYIPLGGNRVSVPRHVFNILVVWTLTGFWHGAAWNFLAWGFYFGVLLLIEKYALARILQKLPSIICSIYTLFIVIVSWVIFSQPDLGAALGYLGGMFGVGVEFANAHALYFLRLAAVPLVIGAICARPNPWRWFTKRQISHPALTTTALVVLFVVCVSFLVFDSYNPFLYFRF